MRFLADTNVLAELTRPRPDPGVLAWASGSGRVAISAVTLEEVAFGLAWKPKPRLAAWFAALVEDQVLVLPVTREVATRAGELRGQARTSGRTRTQADALIAATALGQGLTLVTRNTGDFEGWGVSLLNPFR